MSKLYLNHKSYFDFQNMHFNLCCC